MWRSLLSSADRLGEAIGWLDRPFDPQAMMRDAERRYGLDSASEPGLAEGLGQLLHAYSQSGALSIVGRLAAIWDTRRLLRTAARLQAEERADPSIRATPIAGPLVITGMPRSGTTFLHRLLAEDPANRVAHTWQTLYPYPLAGGPASPDDRRARVEREFAAFARLAPALRSMHPLAADTPQECTEITAHVFQSLRFDTTHRVPAYTAWLDHRGHRDAYRFHRRFLQHLQYGSGPARWVLKCPDHVFALTDLLNVYPDARLVFVHRDPLKVLGSVARLTEVLRRPFTRSLDRGEIGRQVRDRWALGASAMIDAQGSSLVPRQQVLHIRYRAVAADPVGTVSAIYRAFGGDLDSRTVNEIADIARTERNARPVPNDYKLEDFGLDAGAERERFKDYVTCFDVETEAVPATGRLAQKASPPVLLPRSG
jgi:hypothetical protein